MTTISKGGADYIGYEYKEKIVPKSMVSMYLDSYPCFGWEEDLNRTYHGENGYSGHIALRFRRDRKICNKTELTRLQRNFDGCVSEIEALERSKSSMPTMWALIVGIIGTAFIAGSVFAVTANPPLIILCILLAVPGFTGWFSAFFIYRILLQKQIEKVAPLIEDKYDELYAICEKGNRLLV
ncbi:hypothetical protein [Anaerosporobacter sp.]